MPDGRVLTGDRSRDVHAQDRWHHAHPPDCVVMARTRADLESTLAFAHEHGLPVTACGGGVGYVGGCVPVRGGIALSLAEMKTIKEIHLNDAVAIVEPGGVAMREGRRRSYRR